MSELKARMLGETMNEYGCDTKIYLKSEADKVIAEKDKEIAQLQAMLKERNKQVAELKYELAVATGDCQALAGKFGG